ncbi:hypothetical protein [Gordonia neofelifaecis]|uniref:Uncharacterized protein n=1 Tax=Gordonia neofelifaecis NRRL B-59395 TaxID=644548 RepID=F1YE66_9ACTN|nr:hypothetical protein [Gordonia neofelifaecis]EGD57156.1 hypothetical protein SCNU_02240 [Gordonia neofelifaecis NRRL B-59395]
MTGPALGAAIAIGLLAGIAVIALGITLGGPWRIAGGVATAALIAAIAIPAVTTNNKKEK